MIPFDIVSKLKENNKKIIGYGAGLAAIGTLRSSNIPLKYIVDDNPQNHGQTLDGIPIQSPSVLESENKKDVFIIIFTFSQKAILGIFSKLKKMGFVYGQHFVDCSFIHFYSIREKGKNNLGLNVDYELFLKCRMASLYSVIESQSYIAGTWLFLELFKNIYPNIPGCIAECGVYKGGNAYLSQILSNDILKIDYHLFDRFEGFPDLSGNDPLTRKDDFSNVDFSMIKDLFSNFPNVKIHKGFFKETLPDVSSSQFCIVYIDCDLFEPAITCCDFFYDKVPKGGYMLFHDYWVPDIKIPTGVKEPFRGVNKAVNKFFEDKPEDILVFPETTHAIIVKK